MANYTFCVITYKHGYQLVTGYEGNGTYVVLACGHRVAINDAAFQGIDEVDDGTSPGAVPTTTVSVPIEAAIAAAEALPPHADWAEVTQLAQAADNTVTIQTEVAPSA